MIINKLDLLLGPKTKSFKSRGKNKCRIGIEMCQRVMEKGMRLFASPLNGLIFCESKLLLL